MLNKKALSGTAAAVPGWDIEDATWPGTITWYDFGETGDDFSLYPTGLFFKPDGTKMYLVGAKDSGTPADAVYEFNLSTAWDVSTASYLQNEEIGGSGRETRPNGIFFKPDGTKFYIVGHQTDVVEEYDLSTAWNITTSTYNQNFSVATQDGFPTGLFFKTDGTKMYTIGILQKNVSEYNLSTAWDISTASHNQNFSVNSQSAAPLDVFFKSDGTKMYVSGSGSIFEYDLTTAWDVSTASLNDSESILDFSAQSGVFRGIFFSADGTQFFGISNANPLPIWEYSLSTAWDLSTASYVSTTTNSTTSGNDNGLFIKSDGTKLYTFNSGSDAVYQFTFGTSSLNDSTAYAMSLKVVQDSGASGYTVTWPTSVDWPSATAPTLTATASAVDQFVFYTYTGGTTWYGFTAGQALG